MSLDQRGPLAADETWALTLLLPGEARLWRQMTGPDRRHAVGVARRVECSLGGRSSREVMAAALLHDVGKVAAGVGVAGRVVATAAAMVGGPGTARRLEGMPGRVALLGRYLDHPSIGAELLAKAGSEALTVAWVAEHHLPPQRWTVPMAIGSALKLADDD